jgi:hypothetical protein
VNAATVFIPVIKKMPVAPIARLEHKLTHASKPGRALKLHVET